MTLCYKDIEIKKQELVAKTQFFSHVFTYKANIMGVPDNNNSNLFSRGLNQPRLASVY